MNQSQQPPLELTKKQQADLDAILEQALKNAEDIKGIKSSIVKNGALTLFRDGVRKSKIAGLLVKTLANKDVSRKAGISKQLIYKVLQAPEFKALKDEKHANRYKGKGKTEKGYRSTGRSIASSSILAPTCAEILEQEVQKTREQHPGISRKEIKAIVNKLDSVKHFGSSTLRGAWSKVLPMAGYKESIPVSPEPITTLPAGIPQYAVDQQQLETELIKRIEIMQQVIDWLSGMEEWQRTAFDKALPPGKPYTLALEEKCTDHIRMLAKLMPESYLRGFLQYANEIIHLIKVFDEKLYEEKLLRESNRNMASR